MKRNRYKILRVIFAAIFFIPILLYFLDFKGKLPVQFRYLLDIQLVPAILSGIIGLIILLLLLTLFFGRIYCSVICPAGILQDIFIRVSGRGKKQKSKKKRWFHYRKPFNILRYVLLALAGLLFFFGSSHILLLLDPYSNFGRVASNIFRPVVIGINNVIADGLMKMDNYSVIHVAINNVTTMAVISAVVIFIVFLIMTFLHGRLFCNTLCPVGGLLSLFSKYSFFRITFNEEMCNSCGSCEMTCKSECIDSKSKQVDTSRCVDCFNCISSCKKGSIGYRLNFSLNKKGEQEVPQPVLTSRRTFFVTGATLVSTVPVLSFAKNMATGETAQQPVLPPGSFNKKRFEEKCTACHLCVTKCPNQIIKPAGLQFGINHVLKPHLVYEKGYCNYECNICSEVCPNGALEKLTTEEKITTQLGIAHFEKNICVVETAGTDCGACSEHCPTQAVKMVPYKDSLRIPHVTPDICIGCGGCEYICPVRPQRAIHVIANIEHMKAKKPKYEKVEDVDVTDFGF